MSSNPFEPPGHDLGTGDARQGKPGLALGLGIFGLIAWILPIIGLPVTVTGLIFGINAMSSRKKKGMATAATILCAIGLVFSSLNMAVGLYLGATGQHALVNQMKQNAKAK